MTDTLRDRLAARCADIDRLQGELVEAAQDCRTLTAQMRDGQLTESEWIAYLDGLGEWEAEHGRGIFT